MSGNSSINVNGLYGIQGVASSSNYPGSQYSSISWIDSSNSLWLFGGEGYGATDYGKYIYYTLRTDMMKRIFE